MNFGVTNMPKKRAAKKSDLPSDDFIESKKSVLKGYLDKVVAGEIETKPKRETASDKLVLIKDELMMLKDKNIPYTILRQILIEQLDLTVSEQTLRAFCQNRLGFPKQERKKSNSKKDINKDTNIDSSKGSSYDAAKELSADDMKFD